MLQYFEWISIIFYAHATVGFTTCWCGSDSEHSSMPITHNFAAYVSIRIASPVTSFSGWAVTAARAFVTRINILLCCLNQTDNHHCLVVALFMIHVADLYLRQCSTACANWTYANSTYSDAKTHSLTAAWAIKKDKLVAMYIIYIYAVNTLPMLHVLVYTTIRSDDQR